MNDRSVLRFCLVLLYFGMMSNLLPSTLTAQPTFYVAPDGDDENPGTQEKPFASMNAARLAVRQFNGDMTDDIVVVFRGGTYRIGKTIRFDARDSGTNGHDVVYRAEEG